MIAINLALPFGMKLLVGLAQGHHMRLAAVLICAVILAALNGFAVPLHPRLRWWVRGISALNLLSTLLLGSVAFVTALSGWWLLLRWASGGL